MSTADKVYIFGCDKPNRMSEEYLAELPKLLGGKGSGLYKMCCMGMPVPPGFVINTRECRYFCEHGQMRDGLEEEIQNGICAIEEKVSAVFGSVGGGVPLLVSVRSGAEVSMPGMMDTVLNIGICDNNIHALAKHFNSELFALDSYRRLIQMYGNVVLGIPTYRFEEALSDIKMTLGVMKDNELSVEHWRKYVNVAKTIVKDVCGIEFPQDPKEQLYGAINAVMKSWNNERAKIYRAMNGIDENSGTAVTVQAMVFGNLNQNSATGVIFTRNPATGENTLFGEYIQMAQGEDIVSGARTPQPVLGSANSMEKLMPEAFASLKMFLVKLEAEYKDMQDVEFTVQDGKVWILQTRSGKRHIKAGVKIAYDMAVEGIITKQEAILRIDTDELHRLLHSTRVSGGSDKVVATGLGASPGVGCGMAVFTVADAENEAKNGRPVVLIREETSPEDVRGMFVSKVIVTSRGGMTSHAAVVARGMGVPCIVGCESLHIDAIGGIATTKSGTVIKKGDVVSVDGVSGNILLGEVKMDPPCLSEEFLTLLKWADSFASTKVRVNAETALDCQAGLDFGAAGIGLCRTEHMFFEEKRLLVMRKAILCDNDFAETFLEELQKMQQEDFTSLFKMVNGLPINIRLLDPPLHEFLPKNDKEIKDFCDASGMDFAKIKLKVSKLYEVNPMLGNRGARLGVSLPSLYSAQIKSILLAAKECRPNLELMVPFIFSTKEFDFIKNLISVTAKQIVPELQFKVGTMVELPAACLIAEDLAKVADYFSFGTNDLTQTTLGISRDDYESFLSHYNANGIFGKDPFVTIEQNTVGKMVQMACANACISAPSGFYMGVCGEHGGDPESIRFFCSLGMSYVSCSPYRVPIARIAVAQANLKA